MTINVPYVNAVLYLALFSILPLVLGIAVHDRAAAVARSSADPASLIATLAFIVVIVRTRSLSGWAKSGGGPRVLVGVIVLILVSMLIGWIVGGPRTRTRGILATTSSMRNVALCVAIAGRSFPDLPVLAPLVVFGAIMAPPTCC